MGRCWKAAVALVAVVALACTTVFYGVVCQLIINPPEIQFTDVSKERISWQGLGCTWEIQIQNGEMQAVSVRPWPLLRSLMR